MLIATLFNAFVLFATLASSVEAEEKERRLLKGSVDATAINWATKQHQHHRHLKKTKAPSLSPVTLSPSSCGDNKFEWSEEECDIVNGDSVNCAAGEYCDSSSCLCTPLCGNGVVDTGENCEVDGDCTTVGEICGDNCTCVTPVCGNEKVEGSEECDDGNTVSGDGCSASCTNEEAEMSIFGAWHCGNHYCDWTMVRQGFSPGGEFDNANRWLIDRNMDETYSPSVNLIVLSFVQPEHLYDNYTQLISEEQGWLNGLPRGMTKEVVDYFKVRGIKVMISVGGATYSDEWDRVLEIDVNDPNHTAAKKLARRVYEVVQYLGCDGAEIDYENGDPGPIHLSGLEAFIDEYRRVDNYTSVLTLDLAVGNRYLTEFSRRASKHGTGWLATGKLNYVNAMVPGQEPQESQWQEHIDGMPHYNPPVDGKKPCQFTVSLWLIKGKQPEGNCDDYNASEMKTHAPYVRNVRPANNYGKTAGLLGYMFWAAESTSPRRITTTPSGQTCENGMGVGATTFGPPFPLSFDQLRQD